jgi:hypothetical protein
VRCAPLLLLALLALPGAASQVGGGLQPLAPPDWSPYLQREELGAAGDLAGAYRVLRFVQVSDAHILDDDAPAPLRVENLDQYGPPFTAAQRPQEEYTDEVLDAIVRAINAQHRGDPLQFVLNTGDNIDNDLENELMRFLDVYDGTSRTAGPLSGLPCLPDGQSESVEDPDHDVREACTSLPPALAGVASGLDDGLPWLSAFGNHDALIQGNVNPNQEFGEVAAMVGRRFLTQSEYVAMHFEGGQACSPGPAGSAADDFGHGYAHAGPRLCDGDPDNDGYYAFDAGPVRFLVLDTVNDDFVTGNGNLQGVFNPQTMAGADVIGGYAEGSLDGAQAAWVEAEIVAHPDRLIVLVSHHTVNSMFSSLAEGYCAPGVGCLDDLLQESGYKTGPQLAAELAGHPNVVAWVGGHTHRHRVQPKGAAGAGFWNIESASLIDWPQEARTVELWATADGAKAFWRLTDFGHGFNRSKELELTDPQREAAGAGEAADRDVLLWFDVPAGVTLAPLPEVPRQWRLRVVQGAGVAGDPLAAVIEARDALHPDAPLPDGLSATWTVGHGATDGTDLVVVDVPPGTPLAAERNGTSLLLRGGFTPVAGGSHYATVSLLGPAGEVLATQLLSLDVATGTPPRDGKASPGLPALVLLLGLAMALAVLRRRST